MNFDDAFARLVDPQHEGGYVNDSADPGGETYKGVARKMSPTWPGWQLVDAHRGATGFPASLEADAALQAAVRSFYQLQYWGPAGCDGLPDMVRYEMFDLAVNTSAPGQPSTAIKLLQHAIGSDIDGVLGPRTLMAAQSADPARTLRRLEALRILYYTSSRPDLWNRFGKGWATRVANNMLEA